MTQLDIALVETYNNHVIAVADVSTYAAGKKIENPFLEITSPTEGKVELVFVPRSVNVFNSRTLGITGENATPAALPDGIYKFRYSIRPNYENFTEKNILRLSVLKERLDLAFLKTDPTCCDSIASRKMLIKLDTISFYMQYATAAANTCNYTLAMDLYRKASRLLDKLNC